MSTGRTVPFCTAAGTRCPPGFRWRGTPRKSGTRVSGTPFRSFRKEKEVPNEFPVYKGVKRVCQQKSENEIKEFDKLNNIDIYILNNDISNFIEIYKNLGKKVIGIFHGVFFSCIFTNHTYIYNQWYRFELFDSFVQIIADDYWIYKKLNFKNVVYIPNLYTFEHRLHLLL